MPAVTLHLRIRVEPSMRATLLEFLREALAYYEAPGGIRVRLLARADVPDELIEVVEYETVAAYRADQARVDQDSRMRELIARWRGILAAEPIVEVYDEIALGEGR